MTTIKYKLTPIDPAAHLFQIDCDITNPDPNGQRLALPAWIPGSYMIRDFSKHIQWLQAESNNQAVGVVKIDKDTWQCDAVSGALRIRYQVYAWDLSVRAAHLDTRHGFYNGTSVFLCVLGQESMACEVEITQPSGSQYKDWRVATTLPIKSASLGEFGGYQAANYDELIDHPVEMGDFLMAGFKACEVHHDLAITGLSPADAHCDIERICRDLVSICEHQIHFFGKPAPFERYLFQVMVLPEGFGGLEHRASTSLICPRSALPRRHEQEQSEEYRDFLSLCSHEYFHAWNVKRIKPEVFEPYDLQRENHTRLLWAFEGITSYYEDLVLVRCGLITLTEFLEMFAQKMTNVLRSHGRKIQTVAESSFDAWTKFYKQDENVFNSIVSYYTKGALVAFCLDMKIRQLSEHQKSLDDVMRLLWQRHGQTGQGVGELGVEALISELLDEDLSEFYTSLLDSTEELPMVEMLECMGVALHTRPAENLLDKGGKPGQALLNDTSSLAVRIKEQDGLVLITHVINQGAAHQAGIAAGDMLLAIDYVKVSHKNFEQKLKRYQVGERIQVHCFRRDELLKFNVVLQAAAHDTVYLECLEDVSQSVETYRDAWLQGTIA